MSEKHIEAIKQTPEAKGLTRNLQTRVNQLLDTGDVWVKGQRERWLYLSPDVLKEWKDMSSLQDQLKTMPVRNPVDLAIRIHPAGDEVVEAKKLGRTTKKIVYNPGYTELKLVLIPQDIENAGTITWEYVLLIPNHGNPILISTEAVLTEVGARHYGLDQVMPEVDWNPSHQVWKREADLPVLQAFSNFLDKAKPRQEYLQTKTTP